MFSSAAICVILVGMKTYQLIYEKLRQASDFISGEDLAQELGLSRTSIWKGIQNLENLGLTIESQKKKGYLLIKGDLILPEQIEQELAMPVLYLDECDSTQHQAKEKAEEGLEGNFLLITGHQTAGRGRFARPFHSSRTGGIYMTLHLVPKVSYEDLPAYTILTVAACLEAIRQLTGQTCQIKWVNDLYLGDKKIAGILTEASSNFESGEVTDLFIGLGLNFHVTDFPQDLKSKAASLFEDSPTISRNQLITAIWKNLLTMDEEELTAIYKKHSLVLGRMVSFEKKGFTYKGKAIALSNAGHLLIELTDGQQMWLSSGEVSLTDWSK